MNSYADDLAELIEGLDLHDAVLVGHADLRAFMESRGAGEGNAAR
jgi:hypothetical protein